MTCPLLQHDFSTPSHKLLVGAVAPEQEMGLTWVDEAVKPGAIEQFSTIRYRYICIQSFGRAKIQLYLASTREVLTFSCA